MRNNTKIKIVIIGPSGKFLSGVSYFTLRLSNALSELVDVETILFRKMLPKRLFHGWRRVGEELFQWWTSSVAHMYLVLEVLNFGFRRRVD